jgi:hypothetical protein
MISTSTMQVLVPSLSALVGAVIGATAALAGVRWQIIADHKQKRDEQIFNARRDVYAEIMSILNYSFLKGKDLNAALSDPHFKTQVSIHMGDCFSRARPIAGLRLSEKLRELYGAEMLLWKPENTGENTELDKKRAALANEVEILIREDLGITD